MLTAAELAAALRISTRQVQRHVADGMPYQPSGARGKVYDLEQCQRWLQERYGCQSAGTRQDACTLKSASIAAAFTDASRQVRLRAMPSSSRPNSSEPSASAAPPLSLVTRS